MDIEKLIEQLRTESLYADKASLEIMDLCMAAATALSTLQAENEKMRAEQKRVKRERDAAVSDLTFVVNQYRLETTGTDLCGLCEYDLPPAGENGQTAECPGFYVDDCFKWRGPEEG